MHNVIHNPPADVSPRILAVEISAQSLQFQAYCCFSHDSPNRFKEYVHIWNMLQVVPVFRVEYVACSIFYLPTPTTPLQQANVLFPAPTVTF